MSRPARLFLWFASASTTLSGLLYLLWIQLAPADDPFAPERARAALAFDLHLLSAPLLVFALGWIFPTHLLPKLKRQGAQRASGWLLFATALCMGASGLWLPVANEACRLALEWTHGLSGALYGAVFLVHLLSLKRDLRATS